MQDEIFGPILPIFKYEVVDEVIDFIHSKPKPLSLYLFTADDKLAAFINTNVSFGGGCVNDTLIHVGHSGLPFGGVGASGTGKYHGFHSFETFSNKKGILKRGTWVEFQFRFPPYTDKMLKLLKKIIK
jgi:aldehyde dehydrogenase (NAD+)